MKGCRQWQQGHADCVLPTVLMPPARPCIVTSYLPRTVQLDVLLLTSCLAAPVHSCSMSLEEGFHIVFLLGPILGSAGNPAPAQTSQ